MASKPPTTSAMATVDGTDVEYLDQGQGDAVLVVHGSPGGCDQGALLGQFLVDAGFRVIIPSRPGYLRTPLTNQNSSIDEQADAHVALMDALGIDRFAALCWSGGGPSTYRLAARHPQRVQAIVAVAALSGRHTWNETLGERLIMHTRAGFALLSAMVRWAPGQSVAGTLGAEGALSKSELKELTASVTADPKKSEFVLALSLMASHVPPRKLGIGNDQRNYASITDLELPRVQAPVLLIHGDVDRDVDLANSQFAAENLPNATLEVIPKGGHISFWIDPDADVLQQHAVTFLRSHTQADS